jgi:RNA polymerase sigma factor (sigma-70 family)
MAAPLLFLNQDGKLLDLIRKGDEEALVALYASNRRPVTALVTRNNGTAEDAHDVLQEALIVLWERVRQGKFEAHARLSTFIFATARNIWLRQLARRRRETPTDLQEESTPSSDPSPLDEMVESEMAERVARALSHLGEPCKTLLLLFYWEEASMEEIAERLGFANADTAKSKKYQCKKALTDLLREYGSDYARTS